MTVLGLVSSASAAPPGPSAAGLSHRPVPVCDHTHAPAGTAACDAIRNDIVDANGKPQPAATPVAGNYGPADIQDAYKLAGLVSGGRTVAIVDAYNAPTAEADLGVYRSHYNLPPCDSTDLTNHCFTKVSQAGPATALPADDGGWAQEISLDLDMVSAACPDCKILLVEANSSSFNDLATAVNYAAAQPGVIAISNSYGGSDTGNSTIAGAYKHADIAVTASTGDSSYGVSSPASFPGVVAVGGTSLAPASNTRHWTETAWSGAGSGCSRYNAKPSYQTSVTSCSKKATADVSAVADPNTGVAVYDSTDYQGTSGWMEFGGTSAASPIIASVFALAGHVTALPTTAQGQAGWLPWNHAGSLFDVTSGSNGHCQTKVLCNARSGWDGPTGLGTPNGIGGF